MTDGCRVCSKCNVSKELSLFPKNSKCEAGRTRICKECTNARANRWVREVASKNPSFVAGRKLVQEKQRAKQYGLSLEQLEELKQRSGGVCEICSNPPKGGRTSNKVLQIDHCHATGQVRGMLCTRCNLMLGWVEDNPDLLRLMAGYLERSKQ